MADRLDILFTIRDRGSKALDGIAGQMKKLDAAIKAADVHFEKMRQGWQAAMNGVDWGRQFYANISAPGLKAAGDVQQALTNLRIGLADGDINQVNRQLEDARKRAGEIAGPTAFSQGQILDLASELMPKVNNLDAIMGKGGVAESIAGFATAQPKSSMDSIANTVVSMGAIGNLKGDQYAGATDYLFRASMAGVGVDDYGGALGNMGAASLFAIPVEDLIAALDATAAKLNVRGGEAGSSWNALFSSLTRVDKKLKLGIMKDGKTDLNEIAAALREKMSGKTLAQQQKMLFSDGAFDQTAMAAVLTLLEQGGDKSLEASRAQIAAARNLESAVAEMGKGYNAQKDAVGGSFETLLANVFKPALDPLSEQLGRLNSIIGQADAALALRPELNNKLAAVGAGGAVAGGAVALWHLARAGGGGFSGLASIFKGQGAELAQVAAAKAKEQIDGIQPVRVVNWPESLGGGGALSAAGASSAAAGAGAAAAGGGRLGKVLGGAGVATAILGLGAAAMDAVGGATEGKGGFFGTHAAGVSGLLQTMYSLGGLLESDDATARRKGRMNNAVDAWSDKLGMPSLKDWLKLDITVNVDSEGNATTSVTSPGGMVSAASRQGVY